MNDKNSTPDKGANMHRPSQLRDASNPIFGTRSDLEKLVEFTNDTDVSQMIAIQWDVEAITGMVRRFKDDKFIVANAMLESTIWYIIDNFKGTDIDWDKAGAEFLGVKNAVFKRLGPKGGS